MDARVQDYFDDKLQSAADLESLGTLLDSVKAQQHLLQKQVRMSSVVGETVHAHPLI